MAIRPENKKYYGKEWRKLSRELIGKRNNACEGCGGISGFNVPRLTVHHKDRDPLNNDPDNLLVLCPSCHFDEERKINEGYYYKGQGWLFKKKGD